MKKSPAKKKKPNTANKNGKSQEIDNKAVDDEKKKRLKIHQRQKRKIKRLIKRRLVMENPRRIQIKNIN